MRAFATTHAHEHSPATKPRAPGVVAQPNATAAGPEMTLMRKASCACGGGCPSCGEKGREQQLQAKLQVSHPGDAYEREADAVAEHVLSMPSAGRARGAGAKTGAGMKGDAEGTGGGLRVSRRAAGSPSPSLHVPGAPHSVERVLRSAGAPLDASARDFFEPRFMHDFGSVRVHSNGEAAESAGEIRARAYTVGNHIVFGAGEYAPTSEAGRRLLAHELSHTIQQGGAAPHAAESDGGSNSAAVAPQRTPAPRLQRTPAPLIQRAPTDATVEAGTGVGPAITAGTMTTDGAIHGKAFVAENCFGRSGCKVTFNFDKAYKGDYNYAGASGKAARGVYVKISASYVSPNCGLCDELKLLQVLRNITQTGGKMGAAEPDTQTRKKRSGWGDPKAPSRGWRVDATDSERTPYYGPSWVGENGSATKPARLWDTPADWATDTNAGKEFQTCLVCSVTGVPATVLGCVNWGYYIDSSGVIAFRPSVPVASCGATKEATDATQRWDKIPGNTKANIDFTDTPMVPRYTPRNAPGREDVVGP